MALVAWVAVPDVTLTAIIQVIAGAALFLRLMRWRGVSTGAEPLLFILHVGYGWLALGLMLMGANQLLRVTDPSAPLHFLTAGAIGTMTLAVMTEQRAATRAARSPPIVEQSPFTSP